ncbi:hypothetical protein [Oceanobacillus limi]|uniref:hypothetical protein n=1 Tax=Oceanobacillus limi TaxID=930131 RepID=UPI00147D5995|nr:hypothetical protein [Oceanobacillus limi]
MCKIVRKGDIVYLYEINAKKILAGDTVILYKDYSSVESIMGKGYLKHGGN